MQNIENEIPCVPENKDSSDSLVIQSQGGIISSQNSDEIGTYEHLKQQSMESWGITNSLFQDGVSSGLDIKRYELSYESAIRSHKEGNFSEAITQFSSVKKEIDLAIKKKRGAGGTTSPPPPEDNPEPEWMKNNLEESGTIENFD